MAGTGTYLYFKRETESAFNFYREVFGGEFEGIGVMRIGDNPSPEGPELSAEDKQLVMNVGLSIMGGHLLMGSDMPDSFGFDLKVGNNVTINLLPDSREESDRLFAALSEGGSADSPMADMFWGDYWGSCTDKFGIQWMITHTAAA